MAWPRRRSVTRSTSTSTCVGGATRASMSASTAPPSGKPVFTATVVYVSVVPEKNTPTPGAGRGPRGAVALNPLGRDFYPARRPRCRARPAQQGAGPRRRAGPHRRGRGLPAARRSGEPRLPGPDGSQRHDVRPARPPVRVLHLRHALVRERRLRRRGRRHCRAAPGARARSRASTRCGPRAVASARTPRLCSGPAKLCQAFGIDRRCDGVDLTVAAKARRGSATTARRRRRDPATVDPHRHLGRGRSSVAVVRRRGDPNLSRRG